MRLVLKKSLFAVLLSIEFAKSDHLLTNELCFLTFILLLSVNF